MRVHIIQTWSVAFEDVCLISFTEITVCVRNIIIRTEKLLRRLVRYGE